MILNTFFANAIKQLLHVPLQADRDKAEYVLQEKDKHISLLQATLEAKQAQILEMQAKKWSSDAAGTCLDVVECEHE